MRHWTSCRSSPIMNLGNGEESTVSAQRVEIPRQIPTLLVNRPAQTPEKIKGISSLSVLAILLFSAAIALPTQEYSGEEGN